MRSINRMLLGAFASVVGLASIAIIQPAFAADTATQAKPPVAARSADDMIEEVVVTARRREENLQAVPISVTVVSGDTLAKRGVQTAYDLANSVPSLTMSTSGTMTKALMPGIRAISTRSFLLLDDPSVGTYFAESVVAHPWGFGDTFYDIQGVQTLKGPQGTLFGRNTTGGAILIEPNKPSFEDGFNGSLKLTLGDYNLQQFDGMVNIPFNDVAALRIAGEHKKRDGYAKNILSGQKREGVGNDAIRISLLLKPTKDITSNTIVDYLSEDASPTGAETIAVYGPNGGFGLFGTTNPANNAFLGLQRIINEQEGRGPWNIAMISGTNFALPYNPLVPGSAYLTTQQDQHSPVKCDPSSPFFVPNHYCRKNMTPKETLTNLGILNNTAIDFDGFTVKNIFAWRHMNHRNEDSATFPFGSPLYNTNTIPGAGQVSIAGGGTADQNNTQSQVSDELQLQGKAANGKLDWVTGVFYMREWGEERSPSYTNSAAWSITWGHGLNESKGMFAQGTYAVTDRLKWTLGYRKNWDYRNATDTSITQISPSAANPLGAGATCQTFNTRNGVDTQDVYPNCSLNGERTWSANTYTAALDYKLTDDTLIYGLRSRGYKAGGFSLRSHRPGQYPYNPEYMTNTEAGIKADWSLFDRPIRTNLSLFRMDYTNQQLQGTVAGSNPVRTYVDNIGKSRITGYELEVTFKPTRSLELNGFLSYTDAKYLKWENNIGTVGAFNYGIVDLSKRPFPFYSKYNSGLSAAWTLPLDSSVGTVAVRADAAFHSKWLADNSVAGQLGLAASQSIVPGVAGFTMVPQSGYGILNLRADWTHAMGSPIDLAAFVTNVGDKAVLTGGSGVNGMVTTSVGPPRMFGFELSYKFGEGFKPKE